MCLTSAWKLHIRPVIHRHYMGAMTPEPDLSWQEIRERFEVEWREIALRFVNGE